MTRAPLIGVLPLWHDKKERLWMVPGYMQGVQQAGGVPVVLPLTCEEDVLEQVIEKMDGFLFTGGHDVNPNLYGETLTTLCGPVNNTRDEMESWIFRQGVQRKGKPLLAICRGLQIMNVLLGGSLYQDIPVQMQSPLNHKQEPPYSEPCHYVNIAAGSLLCNLLGAEIIQVNSLHHQGIKTLADGLEPMASAPDGLVEAVRLPEHAFAWGVQWHPEYSLQDANSRRLFSAFVAAC